MDIKRLRGTPLVTAKLEEAGHGEVSLYRGDGYHYFIYDNIDVGTPSKREGTDLTWGDHAIHESYSIWVQRFHDYTVAEWTQMGTEFAVAVQEGRYDSGNGRIKQSGGS